MSPALHQLLVDAGARITNAHRDFHRLLAGAFPIGSRVHVKLAVHQVNPSAAKVTGWFGDGRIGVRLEKPNDAGRRAIKRVHWSRVTTS